MDEDPAGSGHSLYAPLKLRLIQLLGSFAQTKLLMLQPGSGREAALPAQSARHFGCRACGLFHHQGL